MENKLTEIKDRYKKEYSEKYIKDNLIENVKLVSELQIKLAEELKGKYPSEEHNDLIKSLHKEFIDFATNY